MFFLINIYENCTNPFDWSRQYSLVQITKITNIFQLSFHPKRIIFNTDDNFMDQLSNQLNIGIQ